MHIHHYFFLFIFFSFSYSSSLSSYNIDQSQTTISGLSSGGCMATQYHVAHSSEIKGVAILAGCAYYCANINVAIALECMDGFAIIPELIAATSYAEVTLSIDLTKNMKNDLIWLYSGTNDTVVSTKALEAIESYYQYYVSSNNQIYTEFDIPAEHGWPAYNQGVECSILDTPYVNNCSYSSSGQFLTYFYGSLNDPVKYINSNLLSFDQSLYTFLNPASVSMDQTGFVYVPTSCQNGALCKLHICFHGCEQGYQFVQDSFITMNELNNYAESNNIIVLYPQAVATAVLNPKGCWDWWGYTGADYATKLAGQIKAVNSMTKAIIG